MDRIFQARVHGTLLDRYTTPKQLDFFKWGLGAFACTLKTTLENHRSEKILYLCKFYHPISQIVLKTLKR